MRKPAFLNEGFDRGSASTSPFVIPCRIASAWEVTPPPCTFTETSYLLVAGTREKVLKTKARSGFRIQSVFQDGKLDKVTEKS